ncbi:uncharacterized protein BJX67DRAFT_379570 [Aspergillus lucknowensis]|uniref:Uncharacterized protein n=1 Tax=Aspergillus lucknowensis TaxID=176173 RepID=A0ABR4LX27_9EURO
MRFFQYFMAALLPWTVFAVPAADLEPKSPAVPAAISVDDYNVLVQRQEDLGGIIGDLTETLDAIKELLSTESLNNINTVVTQAATLLKDPTTKQIKSLVQTAAELLGGEAIGNLLDKLPSLLESVSGLLNKETLNKLITLLDNAAILLTKEFAENTRDLINDIAPLVSAIAQVISALLGTILG